MKFYTGYESPDARAAVKAASALHCRDDSLTVQSDAKDADINTIMARYQKTGQLPALGRLPSYGDFDVVNDFRSALELVRQGEAEFMRLPAAVRADFGNDPAAFSEFASNPANHEELLDMGILAPEVADELKKKIASAKAPPAAGNVREPREAPPGPARAAGGNSPPTPTGGG